MMISAKVRFIQEIVEGSLNVMNKKAKLLEEELKTKEYPMLSDKVEQDVEDREEMKEDDLIKEVLDYTYLTKMPIHQLTYEKKQSLEKEADKLQMEINALKEKALHTIWSEELNALEVAWISHKTMIEESLNRNDGDAKFVKKASKAKKK